MSDGQVRMQVPMLTVRHEYDMAADDMAENQQENAYEHMQTIHHDRSSAVGKYRYVRRPPSYCQLFVR